MERFSLRAQTLTKILCLLFLFAFTITGLSAQVKLSVQGLVKKSDGTALPDGNYDLTFRFYDDETGGSALGTETVTAEINGGVYSAVLGPNGGLNNLAFNIPYYVSVAVDGGTELLPRIALSAAPYAISLQGANNKFPSIGTVKADAIDVAGAVNASGALNVTGITTLSGTTNTKILYADGRIHSNNGFAYHNNGAGNSTGLFFNNSSRAGIYTNSTDRLLAWDDNINYYRATGGHRFDVGDITVVGPVTGPAFQKAANFGIYFGSDNLGLRVPSSGGTNRIDILPGTTYYNSPTSNVFQINGNNVMELTFPFGENVNNDNDWGNTSIKVWGLQRGPDRRNVQYDPTNKRLFFDTSSRRYKRNIKPLEDDFSLVLKVQPKTYTRPHDESNTWEIGYIAEEMDSLGLKKLVEYNADGTIDGFNYEKMILYVTEVVKNQHADIEKLKAEVAALTAEKNALRTENTSLRADVQRQQADFGKQLDAISRRLKSLETAASNR